MSLFLSSVRLFGDCRCLDYVSIYDSGTGGVRGDGDEEGEDSQRAQGNVD
mgnify:CR=1 FL=1